MPTEKKRLHLTLTPEMERAVAQLSKRDEVPQATKVMQLLQVALELDEDLVWGQIVAERKATHKKLLTHEEIWK